MGFSEVPTRLVNRLVLEMQLSCCAACHLALKAETGRPVPLNRAAYLLVVLRCDRSMSPGQGPGGISVSAIAASFDQPFETARRHANALIEDGFCERRGLRIRMRRDMFERPAFQRLLGDLHDAMVRMIVALRDAGVPVPEPRGRETYNPLATVAAAIDLTLAAYEYGGPHFETWLQLRVFSAVFCANGRPLTTDPALSATYGFPDTVPPDDLLMPVTSSAVARVLNLSPATARRQIRMALADGMLERRGNGVIRTRAALDKMAEARLMQVSALRALKIIERLAPEGFRFGDPESHYLGRPPPLLDFS